MEALYVHENLSPMAYAISMTETTLIEACLVEDRLAQKQLFDQYKDAMYTVAYRITNDYELAADVLQEGFVKVFQNLSKFRRESTLGAWIKTIIVRTALSKMRNRKIMEPLDQTQLPERVDWGHRLDAEYLEQAIRNLPQGYRTVFVLVEVEGYRHKEVADLLGITVGTSKSQLYYAKKKLRDMIRKTMGK